MSRSGYSDSCDGWELIMWRGAVASAIRGTRGQSLLHGLAAALDAMPVKRLITEQLVTETGEVCALGSLAMACGRADEIKRVDPEDYEQVAKFFDIPEALAREIQYENDECFADSPEARWTKVRRWVTEQIIKEDRA